MSKGRRERIPARLGNGGSGKAIIDRIKDPLYISLPAVKNNRIFNVSREKWNYGPYLVDQAVDELIGQMSGLK